MGCAGSTVAAAGCTSSQEERVSVTADRQVQSGAAAPCEFHRSFAIGRKLGAGAFGSVYAAARRDQPGAEVAIKIVDPRAKGSDGHRVSKIDKKLRRSVEREVCILQKLPRSENIIQFHALYTGGDLVYMVMEKCSTGLLKAFERLHSLTETTLKLVFDDMVSGILACHSGGIVHRDIKPDNFLVSWTASAPLGFTVKLCDFGLASHVSSPDANELTDVFGTPPFMSPEMLSGQPYNAKVDIWALGVLAYVLLYGSWPYMPDVLTGPAMKDAIRLGSRAPPFRPRSENLPAVSKPCAVWVKALLRRRPEVRLSAKQALIHESFNHPWSTGVSLAPTLASARRMGAFASSANRPRGAAAATAPSDLDRLLREMQAEAGAPREAWAALPASEASTTIGSDVSPASRAS